MSATTVLHYGTFGIFAAVLVASSLAVVVGRNIVRAAVSLLVAFLSTAGLYIVLGADFLAAAQILIYAGAVTTLLLFALMLTRNSMSDTSNRDNPRRVFAVGISVVLLALLALVITRTVWPTSIAQGPASTTAAIGDALFSTYVLPFEVAGVLLLVALVGAILLAREAKTEDGEPGEPERGEQTEAEREVIGSRR